MCYNWWWESKKKCKLWINNILFTKCMVRMEPTSKLAPSYSTRSTTSGDALGRTEWASTNAAFHTLLADTFNSTLSLYTSIAILCVNVCGKLDLLLVLYYLLFLARICIQLLLIFTFVPLHTFILTIPTHLVTSLFENFSTFWIPSS